MVTLETHNEVKSSFRDPSGFLFHQDGSIYRQVNVSYQEDYDHLMKSGLYDALVEQRLLIPHVELTANQARSDMAYKVIKPEIIPFISYPYEWCFSQLKHAALTTLKIQKVSLEHGMSLKDASAYNVQFKDGKPVLIDTLSFERYKEGQPWVAYRQFCQHFFAPLILMSRVDIRLNQLLQNYIDGIPLDLTSALLPWRTRLNFAILSHIHLHSKSQNHFADRTVNKDGYKMNQRAFLGLVDHLESAINKLKCKNQSTEWDDYYDNTNYSKEALEEKKRIVTAFLKQTNPRSVWDIGANTGVFSRCASEQGISVISFDSDHSAVEQNHLENVKNGETRILPLLCDMTNPSSSIGWQNQERMSLLERGPAETVLALALIHHLAIGNNVPLNKIAECFKNISKSLIIEFIPKSDSQVQRLLSMREDIFPQYTQTDFEAAFSRYFTIEHRIEIEGSKRTIYLMKSSCKS